MAKRFPLTLHGQGESEYRPCYRFQSYSSSGGMGTHMPFAAAGCE
jgi:hypothetical protein